VNEDELKLYGIKYVLGHIANDFCLKVVQEGLKRANGDIEKTIKLLIQQDFNLGNCGSYGPGMPYVQVFGGFRSKGELYFPESNIMGPPDAYFTWEEIIQYVKDGCQKPIQPSLF